MFDAQAAVRDLLASDKLDAMLAKARKTASARLPVVEQTSETAVNKMAASAEAAIAIGQSFVVDVLDSLEREEMARQEKVALVQHMISFASRLVRK